MLVDAGLPEEMSFDVPAEYVESEDGHIRFLEMLNAEDPFSVQPDMAGQLDSSQLSFDRGNVTALLEKYSAMESQVRYLPLRCIGVRMKRRTRSAPLLQLPAADTNSVKGSVSLQREPVSAHMGLVVGLFS